MMAVYVFSRRDVARRGVFAAARRKIPPLRQTINAAPIGLLLLAVGNGLVTVAEHRAIGHCCRRGRHCPAIYAVQA